MIQPNIILQISYHHLTFPITPCSKKSDSGLKKRKRWSDRETFDTKPVGLHCCVICDTFKKQSKVLIPNTFK